VGGACGYRYDHMGALRGATQMTMCVENTPLIYHERDALFVKHEECCCPGGPNFSKTRGVWAHISKRNEAFIGVLDTQHSQGGWAVARACNLLGKTCVNFYAERIAERGALMKPQQQASADLGAEMIAVPATMSAVLYHIVRNRLKDRNSAYMMPNALKLHESVEETAKELLRTPMPQDISHIIVPSSSATIAAGVISGLGLRPIEVIVHLGYSRSEAAVRRYINQMAGIGAGDRAIIVDEGYEYKDKARAGPDPDWPCNEFYDLKAYRWWMNKGRREYPNALLWNVG
jgi:Pyridoxal-phosphate dependent enzyme